MALLFCSWTRVRMPFSKLEVPLNCWSFPCRVTFQVKCPLSTKVTVIVVSGEAEPSRFLRAFRRRRGGGGGGRRRSSRRRRCPACRRGRCRRPAGRCAGVAESTAPQLIFGLKRRHDISTAGRPPRHVLRSGNGRRARSGPAADCGFCGAITLERPQLLGVGFGIAVQADQGRPVPAGPDRQHGIEHGRRFVIPLEREQAAGAKLVQGRVVGRRLQGLVGQLERPGVIAGLEGLASAVENVVMAWLTTASSGGGLWGLIGCE